MNITEINITPIKPINGLVAFASCILDNKIYLGSIGILTKLSGGYRLTYPTKKLADKQINTFYPITQEAGNMIEEKIVNKYQEVMNKQYDRHGSSHTKI